MYKETEISQRGGKKLTGTVLAEGTGLTRQRHYINCLRGDQSITENHGCTKN